MKIIENDKINEKVYMEKLSNGLKVIVVPKKTKKKYIIWAVEYGSIDNHFSVDGTEIYVPDGIAHYMEHKLFEQSNGTNSLDVLTSIGVNANAYTTNNHTAYLYEDSDEKFYNALDEFMNYVQNPYFTDENVEKERGIIEQEIMMYDDDPDWKLYMNTMKQLYHKNPINIDVAGTKETIAKIDKDTLYKIYNTFYRPENMVLVVCGDFEPSKIVKTIEEKITLENLNKPIKRIYDIEPDNIVNDYVEDEMNISMPIFMIGYKDKVEDQYQLKKDLAIDIIFNILIGRSSDLYQELYENGTLISEPSFYYENSKTFSHLLIQGQSENYNEVINKIENKIEEFKNNGISEEDFERIKKNIYGEYVKSYNDVSSIATSFAQNYFRNVNPLDYFEEFNGLNKSYVEKIIKEIFDKNKMVVSVIKPKK